MNPAATWLLEIGHPLDRVLIATIADRTRLAQLLTVVSDPESSTTHATSPLSARSPSATAQHLRDDDIILDVRNLRVSFPHTNGLVRAVDGVDLTLRAREILAVVGESGCGKSVMALTLLGLTRYKNAQCEGKIWYRNQNLLEAPDRELRRVRGAEISLIFQDALTSLNPLHQVGKQIVEALQLHTNLSKREAWQRAVDLLGEVGIPSPQRRARSFPHEFSGGMRQRAMIAMALACNPKILIADEPTTALDVTIQAQILSLLARLRDEYDMAVILITHDLGIVADVADTVAVMYAGRIVESAPSIELFSVPQHPYTWGLLGSVPRTDRPRRHRLAAIPGSPPSPLHMSEGCGFAPRCQFVFASCRALPPLEPHGSSSMHLDACWLESDARQHARAIALPDHRQT